MFTTKYLQNFYERESTESLVENWRPESVLLTETHTPSENVTAQQSVYDLSKVISSDSNKKGNKEIGVGFDDGTDEVLNQMVSIASSYSNQNRSDGKDCDKIRVDINYDDILLSPGLIDVYNPESRAMVPGPQLFERIMEYRERKGEWFRIEILQEDRERVFSMCNTPRLSSAVSLYQQQQLKQQLKQHKQPPRVIQKEAEVEIPARLGKKHKATTAAAMHHINEAHQKRLMGLKEKYNVGEYFEPVWKTNGRSFVEDETLTPSPLESSEDCQVHSILQPTSSTKMNSSSPRISNEIGEILKYVLNSSDTLEIQDDILEPVVASISRHSEEYSNHKKILEKSNESTVPKASIKEQNGHSRRFKLHHPFRSKSTSHSVPSPTSPNLGIVVTTTDIIPESSSPKLSRFGSLRKSILSSQGSPKISGGNCDGIKSPEAQETSSWHNPFAPSNETIFSHHCKIKPPQVLKKEKSHRFTRRKKAKEENIESIQAFAAFMEERSRDSLTVVSDTYDRSYWEETLPPVLPIANGIKGTRESWSGSSGTDASWKSKEEEQLFYSKTIGRLSGGSRRLHSKKPFEYQAVDSNSTCEPRDQSKSSKSSKSIRKGKSRRHEKKQVAEERSDPNVFASYKYKGSRASVNLIPEMEGFEGETSGAIVVNPSEDGSFEKEHRGFRSTFFRKKTTQTHEKEEWPTFGYKTAQTMGKKNPYETVAIGYERRRKYKDRL